MNETPLRAAIYIRQSRTHEDSVSPALQESNCRKLAAQHGWEVVAVYRDIDISGGSTDGRDGLQGLREARKAGLFDIALADDLSRFARNVADSALIRGEMPTATWKDGVQDNHLYADIQSAINADELRKIKARWSDNRMRRISEGLPPSGMRQFGYIRVDKDGREINKDNPKNKGQSERYVQDPTEAAILREAYERYIKGDGARAICRDFTERGLPSPGSGGWQPRILFDLCDKVFNAGQIYFDGEIYPGAHQPILTRTEWKAYRDAREERKTKRSLRNPRWMLAGIAVCGLCGSGMVSHVSRGVASVMCQKYAHKGKEACPGVFRKRPRVDAAVWQWLNSHRTELAAAMPSHEEARKAAETRVADTEHDVEQARKQYDEYQVFAFEQGVRGDSAKATLDKLSTAIDDAEKAHGDALAALGSLTVTDDPWEAIVEGARIMGFTEDVPEGGMLFEDGDAFWVESVDEPPSESAVAQFRQALSKIIERVEILPPTTSSPRDPDRQWGAEIRVAPRQH